MIEISSEDFPNFTDSSKVVMLSPDAVDAIDDISKDKVYVIGGLVDRTRKKNFTLNKASERNLVALRLPIEEEAIVVRSIQKGKPVLNVNTVIEILQKKAEGKEWRQCFIEALPKRILKDELSQGGDEEEKEEEISQIAET